MDTYAFTKIAFTPTTFRKTPVFFFGGRRGFLWRKATLREGIRQRKVPLEKRKVPLERRKVPLEDVKEAVFSSPVITLPETSFTPSQGYNQLLYNRIL